MRKISNIFKKIFILILKIIFIPFVTEEHSILFITGVVSATLSPLGEVDRNSKVTFNLFEVDLSIPSATTNAELSILSEL